MLSQEYVLKKDKICIRNLFEHSNDLEGHYMGARTEQKRTGFSNLIGDNFVFPGDLMYMYILSYPVT